MIKGNEMTDQDDADMRKMWQKRGNLFDKHKQIMVQRQNSKQIYRSLSRFENLSPNKVMHNLED